MLSSVEQNQIFSIPGVIAILFESNILNLYEKWNTNQAELWMFEYLHASADNICHFGSDSDLIGNTKTKFSGYFKQGYWVVELLLIPEEAGCSKKLIDTQFTHCEWHLTAFQG